METKNSPYYYGNQDCPPTLLVLKHHDAPVFTAEMPWDASIDDLLTAFYGACVGVTFPPQCVLEAMRDFAEERLPKNNEDEV